MARLSVGTNSAPVVRALLEFLRQAENRNNDRLESVHNEGAADG